MARSTARSKLAAEAEPPRKKRNFFSKPGSNLPVLRLAQAPSPQRQVSSDRILAALQPDKAVVVAAKTFVKDKMGDDKYDVPVKEDSARVTRGAAAEVTQVKKRGRPRKVPVGKTTPKSYAVGSDVSIGQRIKATARAAVASTAGSIARRITLRSTRPLKTSPASPESVPLTSHTESAPPSEPEPAPRFRARAKRRPQAAVKPLPKPAPKVTRGGATMGGATRGGATRRRGRPPRRIPTPEEESEEESDEEESDETESEPQPEPKPAKVYMDAGFFCRNASPDANDTLVNRILAERAEANGYSANEPTSFPPLPLDIGYTQFFEQENDFALPYDIVQEGESGKLDGKQRPAYYEEIECNEFVDRARRTAEPRELADAECRCDATSGCGDNCTNRIMGFLCGTNCQCGAYCTNRSFKSRVPKETRVVFLGERGFGLVAMEDIRAGDFVIDFRGEVMEPGTYLERTEDVYKGRKDMYAMSYGPGEIIDAGLSGNNARFINHGCYPNLYVSQFACLADGCAELEIGLFAMRAIKIGEELLFDYNYDAMEGEIPAVLEQLDRVCNCKAGMMCRGFLGRKYAPQLLRKGPPPKRKPDTLLNPDGTMQKRPRGRPRKHPLPDPAAVVVKRPRGRPRIHPLPDPNAPKRPRGRPRKNQLDDEPGPRRRGRPPKDRAGSHTESIVSTVASAARRVVGRGRPRQSYREEDSENETSDSDDWSATSESASSLESTPEAEADGVAVNGTPASRAMPTSTRVPGTQQMSKQAQKAKRNGAPAGWVYVVDGGGGGDTGSAETEPEPALLTPSGRAARLASRHGRG